MSEQIRTDLAIEARQYIMEPSFMEQMQFWGAQIPFLNAILKPIMDTFGRPLIPKAK